MPRAVAALLPTDALRVQGWGLVFKVQTSVFRVQGLVFRVQGSGLRV